MAVYEYKLIAFPRNYFEKVTPMRGNPKVSEGKLKYIDPDVEFNFFDQRSLDELVDFLKPLFKHKTHTAYLNEWTLFEKEDWSNRLMVGDDVVLALNLGDLDVKLLCLFVSFCKKYDFLNIDYDTGEISEPDVGLILSKIGKTRYVEMYLRKFAGLS